MNWQDYITSDNKILLGKPLLRGTRISVELILELLSSGWTEDMILKSYPSISHDHIKAVFLYLKDCVQNEYVFPLTQSG
jgi:uncharacterized protein (DUF433 family)